MRLTLPTLFRSLRVSYLLAGFVLTSTLPALAQLRPAPLANAPLTKRMRGEEALQALGNRVRDVAEFHRMPEAELRRLFQRDKSLWVNPEGRLFYICEFDFPQQGPVGESTNTPPLNPLYPTNQTFKLHSRPGASRVIYLDFDGHDASTTVWDYSGGPGNAPIARPFDLDSSPHTFNTAERQRIQYIWAHVAEDYMQYDIDVTTEDPGVNALKNTGTGRYGVRVGIGGDSADWFGSAGGVAYLNSFDDSIDLPCWVFPNSLGNTDHNIAVATSHEIGHTLGLSHDGQTTGVEYYTGHGNWAPIMGVGYDRSVVQWSRGEYTSANNTEDDLTRMLSFGAINRADDHGNSIATASPLTGVKPFAWGIISSRTDVDFFSFETGAGQAIITATPAPRGANLHILLSLYNSSGGLVTSAQVADSASTGTQPVTISMNLPAGNYYVSLDGIGVGTASTGYTDYSSLGQYTLAVTLPGIGIWATTAGGTQLWASTANWNSATVPFGLSAIAWINNNISGDQNILIDTPVRIGGLLLGDTDAANTFTIEASGPGILQLGATNGSAWIGKTTGFNDTITAPLQLLSDLTITNAALSDLTLTGDVNGAFALAKFGAGRLVLAGTNAVAGGLAINEGALTLNDTALVADVPTITVAAGATLDVSAFASGWLLAANQTLGGYGTVTGSVNTVIGAQLVPGTSLAAGTLTFADSLNLTNGTVLNFNLISITNTGGANNDLIAVAGDLILDGTIAVNFNHGLALPETNGTYTILTYDGSLSGGATNFVAVNAGNRFSYIFDDSAPGEIRVQVAGAPEALVWQGDDVANLWEANTTTNWLRGGNPDAFFQGDTVLFDIGSASPAISLTGSLQPTSLIVSNTVNYTFSGGGQISGAAALTKLGIGTLTLETSNDFSGVTLIEDGTISIGNVAALGLTNVGTIITNTGQLNLNGFAIGPEPVTISGNGPAGAGAIINSGADQSNALRNVTLAGDTIIGGSTRWDLRGVPAENIPASLTGNGFALTKTGPNQIWLANLDSLEVGNITVNQGTLGFEGVNTIVSNSSTLTVNSGATLAFFNAYDSDFNRAISLNSATLQNDSGHNNLVNTIALSGNNITSVGEAATLDLRAGVSGSGGLTKNGPGILRLASTNSFSGNLVVNTGTVMAGHNSGFGDTNGSTTIASGARLDVAAFNLGAEPINVAGSGINNRGAIINSLPNAQTSALRFVTLTGNTTFGGNGRWDIRGNPTGSLLGAFDLTKVARNEIWLANLGATQLRNITVNEGILGFQGTTTMGSSVTTITVNTGGTLAINGTGTNVLAKTAVTLNTARLINTTGSNVITTTFSLNGSNQLDIATSSTLAINGSITGTGFFNKTAAGTLIVGGTVGSTGLNRVSAGTLQIGAGGLTGSLSTTLTNNGSLFFNRRSDLTHSALIAGTGAVQKQNTNVLTLSGANLYSGATTVSAGTLQVGNAAALGTTAAGTTVASGATLDVNGFSLGVETVTAVGAGANSSGAVINNGATQTDALRTLTLSGDTTLGGFNRWDVRGVSGQGTLSSSGQPRVLTKTGPNIIGLNNVNVDVALGNVFIQQGALSIEQGTTGLGNPTATATVSSNATLNLYSLTNALNKVIVLQDGGKLSHSGPPSGGIASTVSGLVTLSGGNAYVENSSTLYSLQINNAVTGAGNFNQTGEGLVQVNAVNDYLGVTLINSGVLKLGPSAALTATPVIAIASGATFDVSALGSGFVLGPAQSLTGNGTVIGNLIANGAIAPGASVGHLTISGNATLAGQTFMELTKAGATLTNDALNVSGALACGGTLAVAHLGDSLAANDSFLLFSAGAISGSFASYILPTLGAGLVWDVSTVSTDGWLRVVSDAPPVIGSVGLIDGEIVIAGSGGTPGATYYVVTTTNISLPMLQWLPVATNTFDPSGNFAFTNGISSAILQQFFRLQVP